MSAKQDDPSIMSAKKDESSIVDSIARGFASLFAASSSYYPDQDAAKSEPRVRRAGGGRADPEIKGDTELQNMAAKPNSNSGPKNRK